MSIIKEKTGTDIESMIRNKEAFEAQNGAVEEKPKSKRRVQVNKEEKPAGRRVTTANGQELVLP